MLTTETLNRLEAAALKQNGLEFGTTIATMPGELLELVRGYRAFRDDALNPLYRFNTDDNSWELVEPAVVAPEGS